MAAITVSNPTQWLDGSINTTLGAAKVGSSHDESMRYYSINMRYTITPSDACNTLTMSLSYQTAMNSASIVSGQTFLFGIGTASDVPTSSFNVFTWDTDNKCANNLTLEYEFVAGREYYLWIYYDYSGQNNCYVDGLSITSISGSVVSPSATSATITVNSAKGYVSGSNNWNVTYSKTATNKWLISDKCNNGQYLGFRFRSDKPLTKLALSVSWTANTATVSYRMNQSSSPYTEPFLKSDTAMSGTGKTTTTTITYNFAANTDYWIWFITNSSTYSTNPTVTFTPTVKTYTVTLPTGTGFTAAPATGYSQNVSHGNDFKFTVSLNAGYMHGDDFAVKAGSDTLTESDGAYTISNITSNKTVTVAGVVLGGLVWIYDGSAWNAYQPFIYNGSGWEQYMPYVHDGVGWNLCS